MLVGEKAPLFNLEAFNGKEFINIKFEPKKRPTILIFYPYDFTFVCPTEILAFSSDEVKNVADVLFISTDSKYAHKKWMETDASEGGVKENIWPMLSDIKKEVSGIYGVLTDSGVSARATFIVDKNGTVIHQSIYDNRIGRNVDETIRIIESLKLLEENSDVQFCPVFKSSKK